MTSTIGDWFGDPEDSDVTGEFAPDPIPEPGEPDALESAADPVDGGLEANPVDVALQREPAPADEDAYDQID